MPTIDHLDLVVSSIERSLAFYRGLLMPIGWVGIHEVEGERGETIHYLWGPDVRGSLGLREKQADTHPVPYEPTAWASTTSPSRRRRALRSMSAPAGFASGRPRSRAREGLRSGVGDGGPGRALQ
jgi:catechol 2,3-dioxygenase-like lactoylglutathione lyase family enzyme